MYAQQVLAHQEATSVSTFVTLCSIKCARAELDLAGRSLQMPAVAIADGDGSLSQHSLVPWHVSNI